MLLFNTERLIMRPWQESDFEDFYEYEINPNIGPAAGWQPTSDRDKVLKTLRSFIEKPDEVCAVTLRENGKAIGSLGLHKDEKRDSALFPVIRMLGYVLSEDYWNKGYMTEAVRGALRFAFDTMKLELVSVYHFPFNDGSRRVIEKCGFKYEGTLRRACLRFDGAVLDDAIYSMTRDEFYTIYGL